MLIHREQWSAASQRSLAFHSSAKVYEDRAYRCNRCAVQAVFTAAEQKRAYETEKQSIWCYRTLCQQCYGTFCRLKITHQQCQLQRQQNRAALASDVRFLTQWLAVMEALPSYRPQKKCSPMATLLRRLLGVDG